MKRTVIAIAVCAVAGLAGGVYADGKDEAQKAGCLSCHDVDKKKVGPSYKDVAAKMKGKKADEAVAAMKAKPVHKSVVGKSNDASLKQIMEWVLSL
jgi:cytochrome c